MKYYDYEWDLSSTRILLDADLNTDNLNWKFGDYFKLINRNGRAILVKIDPLEKFLRDGTTQNG
jgi:hypothetical protein